jgi:hypothetical protein
MEIIADIVERIRALRVSLDEAFELAGPKPIDEAAFEAMGKIERVASTAAIKVVEQLEDQLARLFRTILQAMLVDTDGWFAQDIANRMEQLGVVANANAWVGVIKLRNRLVHDYPISRGAQFTRLNEAHDASVILHDSADRAIAFLKDRGLL